LQSFRKLEGSGVLEFEGLLEVEDCHENLAVPSFQRPVFEEGKQEGTANLNARVEVGKVLLSEKLSS